MVSSLLLFFGIAFALVFLLRLARVGVTLGFLIAGIIAGPYVLGIFSLNETWSLLGSLGMVFMWFMLGLELSIGRLWKMRKTIFGFGAAQVLMIVVMLFPILFDLTSWGILGTIMVALILAMSSTTEDLQILANRNELQTQMGRQTFSILLFQDLLAIPLLAMLPIFSGKSFNLGAEIIDILVLSIGLILGVLVVGRYIINPLMRRVAKLKSKEIFLMAVMLNIILWIIVMELLNLPPVMGAFLAGMILSETIFRHQIFTDMSPYQFLFVSFFFITLGMGMNIPLLQENWATILIGVAMLLIVKFVAVYIVARVRDIRARESFLIALILAQCGEFGLLMLQTMRINEIAAIPLPDMEVLMAIIILSMILTPILLSIYDALYKSGRLFSNSRAIRINADEVKTNAHVVICGFGRVGQTVAKMLTAQGIPYVAIDMNIDEVMGGREANMNVFYGDTTDEALLRELGLAPRITKAVIVALDNAAVAKRTVRVVKRIAPRVKIFARARNVIEAEILIKEGVKAALPETVESSFMLGNQVLESLGVSEDDINILLSRMRGDNYATLAEILKNS